MAITAISKIAFLSSNLSSPATISMQNESQQSTHSVHILILVSGIIIFAIGLIVGYYLEKQQSNALTTKLTTPSPTISQGRPWPETISEEKDIKIEGRSPELGIRFAGITNTTYDRVTYAYKNTTYILFNMHLSNKDIHGYGQKLADKYSPSYLEFIYEGFDIKQINILQAQLQQTPGYYPRTIYAGDYEIFINKQGIRMKKEYVLNRGYVEYKISLITSSPTDIKYPYRYYTFKSNVSTTNKKYNFAFLNNKVSSINNQQIPEFIVLEAFVNTISNY